MVAVVTLAPPLRSLPITALPRIVQHRSRAIRILLLLRIILLPPPPPQELIRVLLVVGREESEVVYREREVS